jgi:porin
MPATLITNSASALGSLALLLNPPPEPQLAEVRSAAAPEAVSETLLGDWGGGRLTWSDHGFDFTAQYIAELAGNVSGGTRKGTVYNGLLNLAGDVDLEKLAGWNGGLFHVALLYPHGKSLSDKYVNDLFVLSNLDASDDVHLFELWLEQNFADDKFSVRLGQMAVDQEFAFTEQGALFNNSAFGWFPIVGATAPVYPQGAPGVRLKWQASEASYFQFAVVDGDVNPTDAAGHETNPHGVEFRFAEGAFLIAETGYNWALTDDTKPGAVKLGGWYHTADATHVRLDDTGLSLADPLSSGTPASLSDNWGIYLGAEQVLWKENPDDSESRQGLGIFGRCGYAPSDRNTLGLYLEGGVTRTGLLPGRDADVCGVGIAYGQLSHSLRDLGADGNFFNATSAPLPDYELVIEAEYQLNCGAGCVIQPGIQYILHPGGSHAIANALVLNLRTILEF